MMRNMCKFYKTLLSFARRFRRLQDVSVVGGEDYGSAVSLLSIVVTVASSASVVPVAAGWSVRW